MNLRDLKYLVSLADHKHFGRAAAACFISQPTLSTQIKKLEDELGVSLVERAPRRVMLTPAGRDAAERARRIVADVEEMKEAARRSQNPEAGTVRLGIFPTLGPYLLPHVVPRIRERFPQLELLLIEEKTEVILRQLREGRLDAGVLALPLHDDQLHLEFLFEEPFMLAVPGSHPLANARSLTISPTRVCCCSRTATVCAIRRWMSATWPAPAKRTASARPRWKPCARWSPPTSA
jgi:LysR family transcriptional regulator, hydrogen peroxide-inducible genes activator